ncbi:MAG: phage terminase large subunit [Candidatus Moranbacteria bacterium]|nr:phage terminase large subunit [Candidatus Moranbacteria bacterium]
MNKIIKEKISSNVIPQDVVERMIKDRSVRTAVTKQSHFMFFHFYFAHYVKYETAPFQKEIFHITEREDIKNFVCCAFRGSGKSTVITMSYPLWAILGGQQKKFVLILCQTKAQAKQHMINLKRELETNQLLRNDLGPFQEDSNDEWGSSSLVFSKTGARITAASSEQSIRGLRHNQYRPDLIIGDDVEDLASAKTREGREKTYQWLTGEVIPAGDRDTRLIIIGNLLHEDSLLMKLRRDLEEGRIEGVFKEYPLVDDKNNILWIGKYSDLDDIEKEHKKVGNEIAWQREYLLRIVPNEDQVIHREWIKYYKELPHRDKHRETVVGVDLAISLRDTADYTAVVSAIICGHREDFRVYILPNPINKRMTFPQTLQQIKNTHDVLRKTFRHPHVLIEDVGYQRAVIEQLGNDGYHSEGVKVNGDKHSRLMAISSMVQNGNILFPEKGAEELIQQIIGFGVERHDDLVDAFSIIGHHAIKENKPLPSITFIDNPFMSERGWTTLFRQDGGCF